MVGVLKYFSRFDGRIMGKKLAKVQDCPFIDEQLNKKPANCIKQKKRVRFEPENTFQKSEIEKDFDLKKCDNNGFVSEKSVTKVKILMTKEEAARLLSKCKDGRVLEFDDLAHVLSHRSSVIDKSDCLLHSIPEE